MSANIVFEILELVIGLVKTQASGRVQQDANIAGILLQIAGKIHQAYQQQTGKPIDQALIKSEQSV
jgi:hypothetical protein